ncbi:MAG TPA: DNA cytosine methyltransferase [Streptosporangiaceae bacterium]|nr:DNA cytosine methyltransferase [Streptosporangiaceae bacterium]
MTPDGDCAFAATVETVGPARIAEAMSRISAQAGLPAPDLAGRPVTGRDLRLFLADVIEHVRATRNDRLAAALELGAFPDQSDDPEVLSLPGLLVGLRDLGDYSAGRGGNIFPEMLHNLLKLDQVRLGWITDEGRLLQRPEGTREPYTIVLTNEHYLPTQVNGTATARPPAVAPVVPSWLAQAPRWRQAADQSYAPTPGAAPGELPSGLRPGRAAGAVPGEQLRDSLVQLAQAGPAGRGLAGDALAAAVPGLAGEHPALAGEVVTAAARELGLRLQVLRTGTDGVVRADAPAGEPGHPLAYLHQDQPGGRYRPLWPDLPGLGRAYSPHTRGASPLLELPSGSRRADLGQATWYYQGEPAAAARQRVAGEASAAGRLTVFIGAPGMPVTAELLADVRRDLERIPVASREAITVAVFADRSAAEPLLTDALGLGDPERAYVAHYRGTGPAAASVHHSALQVTWPPAVPLQHRGGGLAGAAGRPGGRAVPAGEPAGALHAGSKLSPELERLINSRYAFLPRVNPGHDFPGHNPRQALAAALGPDGQDAASRADTRRQELLAQLIGLLAEAGHGGQLALDPATVLAVVAGALTPVQIRRLLTGRPVVVTPAQGRLLPALGGLTPAQRQRAAALAAAWHQLSQASPDGFDTNCLLTAMAVDQTLADGTVRAVGPLARVPVGYLTSLTGRPPVAVASYAEAIDLMRQARPGARAIIGTTAAPGADTHFINAETIAVRDAGPGVPERWRVMLLDGQAGALAALPADPSGLSVTFTHLPGPEPAAVTSGGPRDVGSGLAAGPGDGEPKGTDGSSLSEPGSTQSEQPGPAAARTRPPKRSAPADERSSPQAVSQPREVDRLLDQMGVRQRQAADRPARAQRLYQALMDTLDIEPLEVPADGDCFYHSIIMMFGDQLGAILGPGVTVQRVRDHLHDALLADLERADAGQPTVYDVRLLFPAAVAAGRRGRARTQTLARIRQLREWNYDAGDSLPQFAAQVFRLRITLLGRERPYDIGPADAADSPRRYLLYQGRHYVGATSGSEVATADVLYDSPAAAALRELFPQPPDEDTLRRDHETYRAAFADLRRRFERVAAASVNAMTSDHASVGRQIIGNLARLSGLLLTPELAERPQDLLSLDSLDRLGRLFAGLQDRTAALETAYAPSAENQIRDNGAAGRGRGAIGGAGPKRAAARRPGPQRRAAGSPSAGSPSAGELSESSSGSAIVGPPPPREDDGGRAVLDDTGEEAMLSHLSHLSSLDKLHWMGVASAQWSFGKNGRNARLARAQPRSGAFKILGHADIQPYQIGTTTEGRRFAWPSELIKAGAETVVRDDDGVRLSGEHPSLVFRYTARSALQRRLIAAALPDRGYLPARGAVHAIDAGPAGRDDQLALLGYLNSVLAERWIRHVLRSSGPGAAQITPEVLASLPAPDWTRAERDQIAALVTELLLRNGIQAIPAGPLDDDTRPHQERTQEELLAQIDALLLPAFGLRPEHLDTIVAGLADAPATLLPDYRVMLQRRMAARPERPPTPPAVRAANVQLPPPGAPRQTVESRLAAIAVANASRDALGLANELHPYIEAMGHKHWSVKSISLSLGRARKAAGMTGPGRWGYRTGGPAEIHGGQARTEDLPQTADEAAVRQHLEQHPALETSGGWIQVERPIQWSFQKGTPHAGLLSPRYQAGAFRILRGADIRPYRIEVAQAPRRGDTSIQFVWEFGKLIEAGSGTVVSDGRRGARLGPEHPALVYRYFRTARALVVTALPPEGYLPVGRQSQVIGTGDAGVQDQLALLGYLNSTTAEWLIRPRISETGYINAALIGDLPRPAWTDEERSEVAQRVAEILIQNGIRELPGGPIDENRPHEGRAPLELLAEIDLLVLRPFGLRHEHLEMMVNGLSQTRGAVPPGYLPVLRRLSGGAPEAPGGGRVVRELWRGGTRQELETASLAQALGRAETMTPPPAEATLAEVQAWLATALAARPGQTIRSIATQAARLLADRQDGTAWTVKNIDARLHDISTPGRRSGRPAPGARPPGSRPAPRPPRADGSGRDVLDATDEEAMLGHLGGLPSLGSLNWMTAAAPQWSFRPQGRNVGLARPSGADGAFRVLRHADIGPYRLGATQGRGSARPQFAWPSDELIAAGAGTIVGDEDGLLLSPAHPSLVFRYSSQRTQHALVAAALPVRGYLPNSETVTAIDAGAAELADQLALLGYLNSVLAERWIRHFLRSSQAKALIITPAVLASLPAPDWTSAERDQIAALVTELLLRNGIQAIPAGPLDEEDRPHQGSSQEELAAEIDRLLLPAFGLRPEHLDTIVFGLADAPGALLPGYRATLRRRPARPDGSSADDSSSGSSSFRPPRTTRSRPDDSEDDEQPRPPKRRRTGAPPGERSEPGGRDDGQESSGSARIIRPGRGGRLAVPSRFVGEPRGGPGDDLYPAVPPRRQPLRDLIMAGRASPPAQEVGGRVLAPGELPAAAGRAPGAGIPRFATSADLALFTRLAEHPALAGGGFIEARSVAPWDFRKNRRHSRLVAPGDAETRWRVLLRTEVRPFAIKAGSGEAGAFVGDPEQLAELEPDLVVGAPGGGVQLAVSHPAIIYRRMASNAFGGRTLAAAMLPSAGYLPAHGQVDAIKVGDAEEPDDRFALLGYLNSVVADWWVRRFAGKSVTATVIESLPLPGWTAAQRAEAGALTRELLVRGGVTVLPGGEPIEPREPLRQQTDERLRARIDALVLHGFGLGQADLETVLADFSDQAIPAGYRQQLARELRELSAGASGAGGGAARAGRAQEDSDTSMAEAEQASGRDGGRPALAAAAGRAEPGSAAVSLVGHAAALRTRTRDSLVRRLAGPPGLAEARAGGEQPDAAQLDRAYGQTVRLLFRTLIVAHAEAIGMLPGRDRPEHDPRSVTGLAAELAAGDPAGLWERLTEAWGDPGEGPALPDALLGPMLRDLLVDTRLARPQPADFAAIGPQELAGLYHELLDNQLAVARNAMTRNRHGEYTAGLRGGGPTVRPGEVYLRQASDRYAQPRATPPEIVDHLLRSTLDPALEEHLAGVVALAEGGEADAAAARLFDFTVADLAMGTGEFLVAALDRIAERYARFLAEHPVWDPDPDAMFVSDEPVSGGRGSALRREIAGRMIYGADTDPVAVSLARLAVQADVFAPGAPVTDVSGHLVQGDSLAGRTSARELEPQVAELLAELEGVDFPARFPEIFGRERPGFDVLAGNPPWGLVGERMRQAAAVLYTLAPATELRQQDLAQLAVERTLALVRSGGSIGLLLPGSTLSSITWAAMRKALYEDADLDVTVVVNERRRLFRSQASLVLLTRRPPDGGGEPSVTLHPVVASLADLADLAGSGRVAAPPGLGVPAALLRDASASGAIPRITSESDLELLRWLSQRPALRAGDWVTASYTGLGWNVTRGGRHGPLVSDTYRRGYWELAGDNVAAYRVSGGPGSGTRFIGDPAALAAGDSRLVSGRDGARLASTHPAIVFPRDLPGRRLGQPWSMIAAALPASGVIPGSDRLAGLDVPGAGVAAQLALLGYLNSAIAGWWVRRFADLRITRAIIEGLPLPDWRDGQIAAVADRVAELLLQGGVTELPGGPVDQRDDGDGRPHEGQDPARLRAEIDLLVAEGFQLIPEQLETVLDELAESAAGLPPRYRDHVYELYWSRVSGQEQRSGEDTALAPGQDAGPAHHRQAAGEREAGAGEAPEGEAAVALMRQRPRLGWQSSSQPAVNRWAGIVPAPIWDFRRRSQLGDLVSADGGDGAWAILKAGDIEPYAITLRSGGQLAGRRYVRDLRDLARRDGRVEDAQGDVRLVSDHAVIIYWLERGAGLVPPAFTALPRRGVLPSVGAVHGLQVRGTQRVGTDTLAVLGYLNSLVVRFLAARELPGRIVTNDFLAGLPLPDWSLAQRRQVAARAAELLIGNGLRELPSGPVARDRPYSGQPAAVLRAEIELLVMDGFRGLGAVHLDAMVRRLADSAMLEPGSVEALWEAYRNRDGREPPAGWPLRAVRDRPARQSGAPARELPPAEQAGTSIELFAGAGGLLLGTRRAGFADLLVVERDRDAADTLLRNGGVRYVPGAAPPLSSGDPSPVLEADFAAVDYSPWANQVDLLTGGVPCTPFSEAGRRQGDLDPNNLWPGFFRVIRQVRPRAVIAENVPGLVSNEDFREYFRYIQLALEAPFAAAEQLPDPPPGLSGAQRQRWEWQERARRLEAAVADRDADPAERYDVHVVVLNAANFGVPQTRRRVFLVALRRDTGARWEPPAGTHSQLALWQEQASGRYWDRHRVAPRDTGVVVVPPHEDGKQPWQTTRDAMDRVAAPLHGQPRPRAESDDPLSLDRPSRTVTAGGAADALVEIDDGSIGRLSVAAVAELMSFPPGYAFAGSRGSQGRQLGNAVPPLLAEAVARQVANALRAADQAAGRPPRVPPLADSSGPADAGARVGSAARGSSGTLSGARGPSGARAADAARRGPGRSAAAGRRPGQGVSAGSGATPRLPVRAARRGNGAGAPAMAGERARPAGAEWLPFPAESRADEVLVVDPGAPGGAQAARAALTAAQLTRLVWQWLRQVYVAPGPDSLAGALAAAAGGSIAERILQVGGPLLEAAGPGGRPVGEVLRDGAGQGLDAGMVESFLERQAAAAPEGAAAGVPDEPELVRAARYLGLSIAVVGEDGSLTRVPAGAEPGGEHPWVFLLRRGQDFMAAEPISPDQYGLRPARPRPRRAPGAAARPARSGPPRSSAAARRPAWWFAGTRNLPGELYAPTAGQQRWLTDNGLQAGWVTPDGDCVFAATVATVGATRIAAAMTTISQRAGLPAPDLAGRLVTGRDLRLFLADVLEHVSVSGRQELAVSLGLGRFPEVSSDPAVPSLETVLAGLRALGDYSQERGGDDYPALLHNLLRLDDLRLGTLSDDGALVLGPEGSREQHTIVLINEHYLPTRDRFLPAPEPPAAAAPQVPGWLGQAARWERTADQSYAPVQTFMVNGARELPAGLRPGQAAGAEPAAQGLDSLAQIGRTLGGLAGLTAEELATSVPEVNPDDPELPADLLTATALSLGVRIQVLRTTRDGWVDALAPVGAAGDPLGYLHYDEAARRYRPLWPELPGLGRTYAPSARRDLPVLLLPGTRAELPQATWYYAGRPNRAGAVQVASHPGAPGRLTVFIGGPGTEVTAELLATVRADLDQVPWPSRENLSLVVFADPATVAPLLEHALGLDDPTRVRSYADHVRGIGGGEVPDGRRALEVTWVASDSQHDGPPGHDGARSDGPSRGPGGDPDRGRAGYAGGRAPLSLRGGAGSPDDETASGEAPRPGGLGDGPGWARLAEALRVASSGGVGVEVSAAEAVPPPAPAGPARAPARRGRDIRWGGPAAFGPTPAPPGPEPAAGGGPRYVPWSALRGDELAGDYQPRPHAHGQGMATGLGEVLSQADAAPRRVGDLPGHEEDVLRQEEDALSLEGADEYGTDSGSAAASLGRRPAGRAPQSRGIGWNGVLIPGDHHGQH